MPTSSRSRTLCAWLVHLYTALGAPVGLFTVLLIDQGEFQGALWLMAVALFLDATDGTLARAARVKEVIPWFDGAKLDDIVDYLNYVFVPCYFLLGADLLPAMGAFGVIALTLIASAYGFSQAAAKTTDHFFLGFPSYWNVVVFYFYVLGTPQWFNAALTVAFAIMVFIPIRYLYPSRSPVLRGLTVSLGVVWGIVCLVILSQLPDPPVTVGWISVSYPVYYFLLSFWLHWRASGVRGSGLGVGD